MRTWKRETVRTRSRSGGQTARLAVSAEALPWWATEERLGKDGLKRLKDAQESAAVAPVPRRQEGREAALAAVAAREAAKVSAASEKAAAVEARKAARGKAAASRAASKKEADDAARKAAEAAVVAEPVVEAPEPEPETEVDVT